MEETTNESQMFGSLTQHISSWRMSYLSK